MNISGYKEKIDAQLSKIATTGEPRELYEPISYILSLGGKRLRPSLVLLACDLFGGNAEDAMSAAIGLEVFHNFTLLHDDIMDKAPLRRNKPTVHEKWDANIAILSGDAMFVLANQLIAQCSAEQLKKILAIYNQTALQVCEGQQMDMNFERRNNVSIAEYEKMISLKTAVLIGACFQIGALLGGATDIDAQYLYDFGKHIGIAFQLQDDILDVYGDHLKVGKQTGGDIISDKKTYLLIKAIEMATGAHKEKLEALVFNGKEKNPEIKVQAVTAIYDELDIAEHSRQKMQSFYLSAIASLSQTSLTEEKKNTLKSFAQSLLQREF